MIITNTSSVDIGIGTLSLAPGEARTMTEAEADAVLRDTLFEPLRRAGALKVRDEQDEALSEATIEEGIADVLRETYGAR